MSNEEGDQRAVHEPVTNLPGEIVTVAETSEKA